MAVHRRKQSNAMLYTLITFVGLFIVSTTIAVIYYVEAEDKGTRLADAQEQLADFATDREQQTIGTIVGSRVSRKTWLGTMTEYLDKTVSTILGGVPAPTSAEVKISDVNTAVVDAKKTVQDHIDVTDPNTGLIQIITRLTTELNNTKKANLAIQKDLDDQKAQFEITKNAYSEREQAIRAERDALEEQVNRIRQDYNDLSNLLKRNTEEQVSTLLIELRAKETAYTTMEDRFLKTQAELDMAKAMIKQTQQELTKVQGAPDPNMLTYQFDGNIILIDDAAKSVHLNIGSNQHVYQGLTFSVYDKNAPMPKDGKGKAEVEVYDLADTYSAARIIRSEVKNPVLIGDNVANVIWSSDKTNVFAIAGDFDLDKDETIDQNADSKITSLIEKWGGKVSDAISINTDYLLLGDQPQIPPRRPTMEDLELDPRAMERYEASLQKLNRYNQLKEQAQALWIPILTYDKFLYFTGYKGQIKQAGAF